MSFPHSPGSARRIGTHRARGLICGLTRGTTAAHVARATIESIAYQVRDVFDAMRVGHCRSAPVSLLADGGASRNDTLMQFQADMLGCPVVRTASADLSALGAAWLAGLATDIWPSLDALAQPAAHGRSIRAVDEHESERRRRATPAGPTPFDARAPVGR